jgi:hypothetical protein
MENFLKKILPWRVVLSEDYMIRFFVWGSRGEGEDGRGLRLHIIKGSDSARMYHDHPYNFKSLLLKGTYFEHTPEGSRWYRAGQINRKTTDDWHRLDVSRGNVWSLVWCGPRLQDWGFWSGHQDDPKIPWREYNES